MSPLLPLSALLPIPRRKQRPSVAAHLQEMPMNNDHSVSLPPEIWDYIASLLEFHDLSPLYLLSRPFYHAFLSCKYRCVLLHTTLPKYCNVPQELAMLCALRNPFIQGKIRMLYFDSHWDTYLISALDLEGWKSYFPRRPWSRLVLLISGRIKKAKCQAIHEATKDAMSMLSHVTDLTLVLDPKSNTDILDALWIGCSQTLVHLRLSLDRYIRTPDHTSGLGPPCPRLRSLDVTVFATCPTSPHLLNDLRTLIPEDGGCMEELTIRLYGHQPAFFDSTSFGSLTKLSLFENYTSRSSILPFIAPHRDTLQEITIEAMPAMDLRNIRLLSASILTALSVPADQLLDHHEEIFPFISRCACLRTLSLSHDLHLGKESSAERMHLFFNLLHCLSPSLTHLTFPGLIMDYPLLLSISQCLPNIIGLGLSDCYLANGEIRALFLSRLGKGHPDSTPVGRPWIFRFEDLVQARMKASEQDDSWEGSPECVLRLFFDSMTHLYPCCGGFR